MSKDKINITITSPTSISAETLAHYLSVLLKDDGFDVTSEHTVKDLIFLEKVAEKYDIVIDVQKV